MPVPVEMTAALLPLFITAPLYMIGRKLWFNNYTQSQMHTIKPGRVFTLIIGLLHIALTIAVYVWLFF